MNILRIFQKNLKKLLLLALMIVLPIYVIQEFLIIPSLPDDLETGDLRMIWYTLSIWLISLFLYVFRISVIKLSYDSLEEKDTGISELMDFSGSALAEGPADDAAVRAFRCMRTDALLFSGTDFIRRLCVLSVHIRKDGTVGQKGAVFIISLYEKKSGKSGCHCVWQRDAAVRVVIRRFCSGRKNCKRSAAPGNCCRSVCPFGTGGMPD